jgi:hypothetical protein
MQHRAITLSGLAIVLLLAGRANVVAAPATFVSGTGSDAGTCTASAPCATFQFAHDKTDTGGSINVLTSGSFGPIIITKSINIVAQGVTALIQTLNPSDCTSGTRSSAVCVKASASSVVRLSGLTIDLNGAAAGGIVFDTGAALHVQRSFIQRTARDGIDFFPQGASELYVSDTTLTNVADGIFVEPGNNGTATAVISRVRVEKAGFASVVLFGPGVVAATIRDSVLSGVLSSFGNRAGIIAQPGNKSMDVTIDRASIQGSDIGVDSVLDRAFVRIGRSTITGTTRALRGGSGTRLVVHPGNVIDGNGNDEPAPLQRRGSR